MNICKSDLYFIITILLLLFLYLNFKNNNNKIEGFNPSTLSSFNNKSGESASTMISKPVFQHPVFQHPVFQHPVSNLSSGVGAFMIDNNNIYYPILGSIINYNNNNLNMSKNFYLLPGYTINIYSDIEYKGDNYIFTNPELAPIFCKLPEGFQIRSCKLMFRNTYIHTKEGSPIKIDKLKITNVK